MAVAIIAEYNPFHNGHIYQLQEAKKRWPNEKIIIIMSGKYVQRGEYAVASFAERKKYALQYGADEVIELPFEYATQAAHIFAKGAVLEAYKAGADKLFFGSESNDANKLMEIAKIIKNHENEYNRVLKKFLKQGYAFPKAAAESLSKLIGNPITLPNDILGLEYCKTIIYENLPILPVSLKRTIDFHSQKTQKEFASASLIRKMIYESKDVSKYTPMKFNKPIKRIEDQYSRFQEIVKNTPASELAKNQMISEGMENLFKKNIDASSYEEFINRVNSKRYTSSRIKRVILYVLLNINTKKKSKKLIK